MTPIVRSLTLLIGLALGPAYPVRAQFYPDIDYDLPTWLAPGVTYRHACDPLVPWQIDIVEIDLNHVNVELHPVFRLTPGVRETTSSMAARSDAVAAVNGGYFNGATATSLSHVEIGGQLFGFNASTRPPRSTFGLWGNHTARLVQTPVDFQGQANPVNPDWGLVIDAIGGGPNLVTDGAVDVRDVEEGFDAASGIDPNGRQPRTALGWSSSARRVFLVTVDGRQPAWSVGMTLDELARLLIDLGCDRGLNYDGGGSTTCWADEAVVNRPSDGTERAVVSAWVVVPSFVVDNTDAEASVVGAWFPSANSGFYNVDSLVKAGGAGTATVTWTANLQRGGLYKVYAWWVASSNRPPAARYEVHHRNGVTSVYANQQTNGSQWNLLDSFEFDPAGPGFVVLADDVPGSQFVSADAVKFVLDTPDALALVVDDADPGFSAVGDWVTGTTQPDKYGSSYRSSSGGSGADAATWDLSVPKTGRYEICVWYPAASNRAPDSPFTVNHADGSTTVPVNQQINGGRWIKLGDFRILAGGGSVGLTDQVADPETLVVADAVQAERHPTADGDTDFDYDIDLQDLAALAGCLDGPDVPLSPPCDVLDFDSDHDVDLRDVAEFQKAYTG